MALDASRYQTLSFLIHAEAKAGKSTLAGTAPAPILVFDAEGSTKFLPYRSVFWRPVEGPPPVWDGSWDACVVIVNTYDDLKVGYDWLNSGQHTFNSVVLDSITEIQRKLKDKIAGQNKLDWDDWDEVLRRMSALIRDYRDLTSHPSNPVRMTVFVAETKMRKDRYWPAMQGQIIDLLPYAVDVVGYLWVENVKNTDGSQMRDAQGEPYEVRRLLTRNTNPLFMAGQRVQTRIPAIVDGLPMSTAPATIAEVTPNLTSMLLQVFPNLATQQDTATTKG